MIPLTGSPVRPLWKEILISRAFSTYPPGYPAMEPSLQVPSQSSHRERCPTSIAPFSHLSKSLVEESTPGCPTEPP